jgi:hypothetical protein
MRDARSFVYRGAAASMSAAAPPPTTDTTGFHLSLAPARSELRTAITTGRMTLAALLAITLGLIGFYYATRNIQGGG